MTSSGRRAVTSGGVPGGKKAVCYHDKNFNRNLSCQKCRRRRSLGEDSAFGVGKRLNGLHKSWGTVSRSTTTFKVGVGRKNGFDPVSRGESSGQWEKNAQRGKGGKFF